MSLFLAAAAPAAADSIVYAKQGNLFLTLGAVDRHAPADHRRRLRVTVAGRAADRRDPLQAAVQISTDGRRLIAPIAAWPRPAATMFAAGTTGDVRDGTRFAYYFYVQTSFDDYENDIRWINTGSYGTWTYADRFTNPSTESEYERSFAQPEWVTNDRLLGTQGMFMNMWTWKLGTGHDYTYPAAQWWFGLRDPIDEWGVAAYHWYDDPALSRDGRRFDDRHRAAWSSPPPRAGAVGRARHLRIPLVTRTRASPSRDRLPRPDREDREPDVVARWVTARVRRAGWRARGEGRLLRRHVCSWPAVSVPRSAPRTLLRPASVGPASTGAAPVKLTRVSLRPRTFRRVTTVRFTLSAPARVMLKVKGGKAIAVNGKAGADAVRFKPRVSRGRHSLVVRAAGASTKTTFRVR